MLSGKQQVFNQKGDLCTIALYSQMITLQQKPLNQCTAGNEQEVKKPWEQGDITESVCMTLLLISDK